MTGPCDWEPLYADCSDSGCSHLDSLPVETAEVVLEGAVTWLWDATLRRYGNCSVTILPCNRGCSSYGSSAPWVPYRTAGGWVNVGCNRCGNDCSCSYVDQLVLPTVGTVEEVVVDGDVLSADAWTLYNRRVLTRIDGGTWPTCQDLATPEFTVTYTPGAAVPRMGQLSAGTLTCQMARRICGQACELPANTTAVTRQGVSIVIEPGMATGIWLIDQWVEMMNKGMSKVWSPGLNRPFIAPAVLTSP